MANIEELQAEIERLQTLVKGQQGWIDELKGAEEAKLQLEKEKERLERMNQMQKERIQGLNGTGPGSIDDDPRFHRQVDTRKINTMSDATAAWKRGEITAEQRDIFHENIRKQAEQEGRRP